MRLFPAIDDLPAPLRRYVERHRGSIAAVDALWDRYTEHRFGVVGLVVLAVLVGMALFPDVFALHSPSWTGGYYLEESGAPSPPALGPLTGDGYWAPLGTDTLGRGVYSLLVYGANRSLTVALVAGGLSAAVGVPLGVVSGYYSDSWVDEGIQRLVDVGLGLPYYAGFLLLFAVYGYSLRLFVIAFALRGWTRTAAVVRGKVLTLSQAPYVESAKVSGGSDSYVMVRHLLPQVLPLGFVYFARDAALAVIIHFDLVVILGKNSDAIYSSTHDPFLDAWGQIFALGVWSYVPGAASQLGGASGGGSPGAASVVQALGLVPLWMLLPPGAMVVATAAALYFVGYSLEDVASAPVRTGHVRSDRDETDDDVADDHGGRTTVDRLLDGVGRAVGPPVRRAGRSLAAVGDRVDLSAVDAVFVAVVLVAAATGTGYALETATDVEADRAASVVDDRVRTSVVGVTLSDGRLVATVEVANPTEYPVVVSGGFVGASNETAPKLVYGPADEVVDGRIAPGERGTVRIVVALSPEQRRQLRRALMAGSVELFVRFGLTARAGVVVTDRTEPIGRSVTVRLVRTADGIAVRDANGTGTGAVERPPRP